MPRIRDRVITDAVRATMQDTERALKERRQLIAYQMAAAQACLNVVQELGAINHSDRDRYAALWYMGHLAAVQGVNPTGALVGKLSRTLEVMAGNDGIEVIIRVAGGRDIEESV